MHEESTMNLRDISYVCRKVDIKDKILDKVRERETVMICIKKENSNTLIPHPLTYFISRELEQEERSVNTYLAYARTICRFMNFVISRIANNAEEYQSLSEQGISGLRRIHAVEFLNYKTAEKNRRSTVKDYDYHLSRFFIFLMENGWIKEEFSYTKNDRGNITSIFNKIPGTTRTFPKKNEIGIHRKAHKLKDFGKNRHSLVPLFIKTAMEVAPDIAFGVCLEFYGGLRRGEVINITLANIHEKSGKTLIADIRDNRRKLFGRLKDNSNEYPKRLNYLDPTLARQQVYVNDLVWEVYYQHMKKIEIDKTNGKYNSDGLQPLFYDSFGQPMSAKVFENRFKKVKKRFLEKIIFLDDYELFKDSSWSTHIGRGCYTNLLMDLGFSVTQIAIARGDTNINSAMEYVDSNLSQEAIQTTMDILNSLSHEQFGIFDTDMLKEIKIKGRIYGESRTEIEYF